MRDRCAQTSIAGRRVLITGGSSGIGLACAQRLAADGARIALLARGADALQLARDRLPGRVATIAADVTDAAAMREAVSEATARLGGLDAVVAGAGAAAYGPFADMTVEDYERTVRVTLLGVLNTAHAALPQLSRSGGTLVVVSSTAAASRHRG
jgi:NAD(P)-dependent dehydrogenase (short-subunit alcohol dehydrogenase family)